MSNELQFNPQHDQFLAALVTQTPPPAGVRFPPGVYRFVNEEEMADLTGRCGWRLVAMTTVSVPVLCKAEEIDQKKLADGHFYGQQAPMRVASTTESVGLAVRFLVMEDEESRVRGLTERVASLEAVRHAANTTIDDLRHDIAQAAKNLSAAEQKVLQARTDHERISQQMRDGDDLRRKGEAELSKLRLRLRKLTEAVGTLEAKKILGDE